MPFVRFPFQLLAFHGNPPLFVMGIEGLKVGQFFRDRLGAHRRHELRQPVARLTHRETEHAATGLLIESRATFWGPIVLVAPSDQAKRIPGFHIREVGPDPTLLSRAATWRRRPA